MKYKIKAQAEGEGMKKNAESKNWVCGGCEEMNPCHLSTEHWTIHTTECPFVGDNYDCSWMVEKQESKRRPIRKRRGKK